MLSVSCKKKQWSPVWRNYEQIIIFESLSKGWLQSPQPMQHTSGFHPLECILETDKQRP